MTTCAITCVSSPLGRALAVRLAADPVVTRIVGIDRVLPPAPPAKLDLARADLRDAVLARVLVGVDVLVHLDASHALVGCGNGVPGAGVHSARNVLAAAAEAGVGTVVHVSTALVYGARETNAVPLAEDVAPAAGPGYPVAHDARSTEDAVWAFARAHPQCRVVVLRPVTVLGSGVDSPFTRHLESPLLPMVRGYDPPVQFVDVDDVAAAVQVVVADPRATGAYNVAADGWLTTSDVRRLLERPTVHLPVETAVGLATLLHRAGLLTTPPGALEYLMHPWVVDTSRLRMLGWHPTAGQRDLLHQFVAEHGPWSSIGRIRVRTAAALAAITGAVTASGLGAAWFTWRRWRARRARPPSARARRAMRRTPGRSSAPGSS